MESKAFGLLLMVRFSPAARRAAALSLLAVIALPTRAQSGSARSFTDIAFQGHGNGYTSDFKRIKMSLNRIQRLQDSILEAMTATPETADQSGVAVLDPSYVEQVLTGFDFETHERVLVRGALIEAGLDLSPTQEREAYAWRADLLHRTAREHFPADYRQVRTAFDNYYTLVNLKPYMTRLWFTQRDISEYNSNCAVAGVSVPPDLTLPTAAELAAELPVTLAGGWVLQGELPADRSILGGAPARVVTNLSPGNLNVCYALPRMFPDGRVNFLGVICQGKVTGKACFWDNLSAGDDRLHYAPGETMKMAEVQNGGVLDENCTNCHRGGNAFNIHPGTPLDNIPQAQRDADVRYQPIGQTVSDDGVWENPAPISPQGPANGACARCHEIGAAQVRYCGILEWAIRETMPLTPPRAVGPGGVLEAAYAAHITRIRELCVRPPE